MKLTCGCSTAVSIQVFQTWDRSSILRTRTKAKIQACPGFLLWYNETMSFLGSRFASNSSAGQFHSSGMTDGDSVTGSGSAQSFEQRQQVEKNRQNIAAYKEASVVRQYRNDAYSPDGTQKKKKHYGTDVQEGLDEQKALRYKRSSRLDVDERSSSRIRQIHSSRIDVVKSTRQGFNAGQSTDEASPRPTMPERFKPTFSEPTSRKYNPYQ